ncbi:MAG TPA: hypothetical protein DHV96_05785 [Lachnospiraceae bacterium]|nr:hypothetical protein [Lachnospiraceae bacterium]
MSKTIDYLKDVSLEAAKQNITLNQYIVRAIGQSIKKTG